MTRIQMACYCLLASAFLLAGLLVTNLSQQPGNEANAQMVVSTANVTLMTARTRAGEEALFLLDNASERVLIYRLDLARKELQVSGVIDLQAVFGAGGGSGGGGGGRR